MILPGATLGVMGGGQLGRMFLLTAHRMGYRVWVLDPNPTSPAGILADRHLCASYTDAQALQQMARHCEAVTIEFENVPAESLTRVQTDCRVCPPPAAVALTRDRILEKGFLQAQGLATAAYAEVRNQQDLVIALKKVGLPALLKTATSGYDGKGQATIERPEQAAAAFTALGNVPCVLEQRIDLALELSVVLARNSTGEIQCYPPAENQHQAGILDLSIIPARVSTTLAQEALAMAQQTAEKLNYCGVMAVEFFVDQAGTLLINEIAPRPHNSGHFTQDACVTSQFEQQLRTLCCLPLGESRLLTPVVMLNLLGERWSPLPSWSRLLALAGVKLHLYGKNKPAQGRKMGHLNCLGLTTDAALEKAAACQFILVER